jgi:DeoR/GlpR family transcriptional regulator of sugar metabolism
MPLQKITITDDEIVKVVKQFCIARAEPGVRSADVATILGVSERTARRRLAGLVTAKRLTRASAWIGSPPAFTWLYKVTR